MIYGERRRVRKLRLGVVAGLNDQLLALQQLALDYVIHIDKPVICASSARLPASCWNSCSAKGAATPDQSNQSTHEEEIHANREA
jgi:hypothetical protein